MADLVKISEIKWSLNYEGSYCTTEDIDIEVTEDGLILGGVLLSWSAIAEAKDTLNGGMPFAPWSTGTINNPAYKAEQERKNQEARDILAGINVEKPSHKNDPNGWS